MSVCKVDELTSENSQLKERVALLEKLLDMNKQDGQLLSKMVNVVCHCHCQVSPVTVISVCDAVVCTSDVVAMRCSSLVHTRRTEVID